MEEQEEVMLVSEFSKVLDLFGRRTAPGTESVVSLILM